MKKLIIQIVTILFSLNALAVNESNKIDITSDKLEVEKDAQIATFYGNVKALYKDITLIADKVKVNYDAKAKDDNKIKVIIATGNVVLIQQGDRVDSQYAEYHMGKNEIIFKNNVTLNRNGNIIKGDYLTIDVITKKAEIKSTGKKRVKAIYFNRKTDK